MESEAPPSEVSEIDTADDDSAFFSADSAGASVSFVENVRNYIYENGRSYHSYQEGKYTLPNDEQEQERLDLIHHLYLIWLRGELFRAPIQDPRCILDIGTGTGLWAIEVAERFPNATVIGNDLSPIQPNWVLPNLRFEVDDVELEWTHPPDYFDFIHIRGMSGCIQDWDCLMQQAYRSMAPGGWVEFTDFSNEVFYDDPNVSGTALQTWYDRLAEASEISGRPMKIVYKIEEHMTQAGFVDFRIEYHDWPYYRWMDGRRAKEIGRFSTHILIESLPAFAMGLLTRHLNWTREEVETLCAQTSAELRTRTPGRNYSRGCFAYARKPFPGEVVQPPVGQDTQQQEEKNEKCTEEGVKMEIDVQQ